MDYTTMMNHVAKCRRSLVGLGFAIAFMNTGVQAGGVTFHDIVPEPTSGISYHRTASPRASVLDAIKNTGLFRIPEDMARIPLKPHGAPGVAVFDYDGDGDLDVYVTNGPGTPNSLYSNQYVDTGSLSFIDVSATAGVGLTYYDSTGVCFGDIDNDGDNDLMVLTVGGPNHLFANQGNGGFLEITDLAGTGGADAYSTSCAMGDIDNDGLLDIVVGNTYSDWSDNLPIVSFQAVERHEHNQLFRNLGGNRFADISERAGIRNFAGISWAISMVDYDLDGDIDIVVADDQGAKPSARRGGRDLGYVRVYENDGAGHFSDVTKRLGTDRAGAWMGLAFADLDADGHMDIFASNVGDYFARMMNSIAGFVSKPGDWLSGWFLQEQEGRYRFPGVGRLEATPFGWGNAAVDYDNDGDTDIVYHGGIDMGAFVEATNAGTVLENDGTGHFARDAQALSESTNHTRREVNGVAVGDLNDDGFADVVSVASQDWPQPLPMSRALPPGAGFGGPFDDAVFVWPTFMPVDPSDVTKGMLWTGMQPADGSISMEISSGNANGWAKVRLVGGVGLARGARVNRSAIGAVISFTPDNLPTAMVPISGGSSYASQHSLEKVFGMSDRHLARLEVLWPGGVRNRLYRVRPGERLVVPEIPCSYDDTEKQHKVYRRCVKNALEDYYRRGIVDHRMQARLYASAMTAFSKFHHHDGRRSHRGEGRYRNGGRKEKRHGKEETSKGEDSDE